ncbi:LPS export ABC transporter ATP-binding protein [Candidatus Acetothermia bacterium]|nr:MAG: LPS export ABC transporter ATP-binding protein [Candidatus Acetothermia bacterium]
MALEGESLVKRYNRRPVVDRLSISAGAGRITGLLGPNGAGKTTTFYLIIGFIAADGGSVSFDGRDISTLPFYRRARLGIGYLPQEPSVFTRATVVENLDMTLEWKGSEPDRRSRREGLLAELGLARLRNRLAGTLSSGERRRLEIARALATSPRYVLLDEPFSGIDPISIDDLKREIISLKDRGIGVIITDHNVRDTLSITDFSYLIDRGRLISSGTSEEILVDPLARRVYLGEGFRP